MADKFRAVLFDLDGTLIDSAPDFIPAVNQLREEHHLPPLASDCIRATVSNGARALVSLALNTNESDHGFEAQRLRLLELYRQHLGEHSQLFPGIQTLLTQLQEKNIPWGIATNKPEEFTTPLLKKLNITPAAACVICPDHVSERKPHPESIFLGAKILDCNATEIVYIGDHKRDMDCGNRAGATTIAALYGYIESGNKPCDWRANYNIISADEIWPLIESKL
jgi:2-phosphoglycolate phosphatase|tara:strand:- start:675 stop:1343 length:669 start_codon:yes stop_codon:yes gene_type:complete